MGEEDSDLLLHVGRLGLDGDVQGREAVLWKGLVLRTTWKLELRMQVATNMREVFESDFNGVVNKTSNGNSKGLREFRRTNQVKA